MNAKELVYVYMQLYCAMAASQVRSIAFTQWRIQGEISGCHGSPFSVYSYVMYVALVHAATS